MHLYDWAGQTGYRIGKRHGGMCKPPGIYDNPVCFCLVEMVNQVALVITLTVLQPKVWKPLC
jgi:hypothetical protein